MSAKHILITGTSKGIGKYLAQTYLEQGHKIIGCSRSAVEWAHEHYQHFQLDVANEEQVQQLFFHLKRDKQKVEVLINNAGIAAMNHSLLTPLQTVERMYKTNVFGSYLMIREAAKLMMLQNKGRIINFTSIAAPLNLAGEAAYAASKASIESLTRTLSHELGEYGITVNAVGPTAIDTDLTKSVHEDKLADLRQRQAIKRAGRLSDIANVINFFMDDKSDFISGQSIYLGGVT